MLVILHNFLIIIYSCILSLINTILEYNIVRTEMRKNRWKKSNSSIQFDGPRAILLANNFIISQSRYMFALDE